MRGTGLLTILFIGVCLLLSPLLGVYMAGMPVAPYLEFPPLTRHVEHAEFSWPIFMFLGSVTVTVIAPVLTKLARRYRSLSEEHRKETFPFPWWGWLGVLLTGIFWFLAWNRFSWFAPMQKHTFTPLWIGYILVANAVSFRRTGRCLLIHRGTFFIMLFPLSAAFWWFFEYLNRFVQNWYYLGVAEFSPGEYVLFASISFSTVLPAVLSTMECLQTFRALNRPLMEGWKISGPHFRIAGWLIIILAVMATSGLGLWPDYLFPLVWMAPFFVVVGVQWLFGVETSFTDLRSGDWRPVVLPALAALICGFFWELWNFQSLAHWEYTVPFVNRFHLFEMPALGYAGYLPFGLECLAAASLLPNGNWVFPRSS